MTSETDAELIAGALKGERLAAERLVERYRRLAVSVAFRALGNADDAQDVAQESLVYTLQRLRELREPERFGAWLRHITLSLCADYRRRRGTRSLGEPLTSLNEAAEEADFVQRLAVRQAVAHLSETHRTTLLLHYVGGWSREEIASLLEIPLNTVRSRLMAAKRLLRAGLAPVQPSTHIMPAHTATLPEAHASLIATALPGARVHSIQDDPEAWMPFTPRVRLSLADGSERTVDFRGDITPERAELLPVLERLGVPRPRLIHGPVSDGRGGSVRATEPPRGENLSHWAMGGTPHRIRLATERAFESIDRLEGITEALQAEPLGRTIPRRTLADEAAALRDDKKRRAHWWLSRPESAIAEWREDPWFADRLDKVEAAIAGSDAPLVYTEYLWFFPGWVRVQSSDVMAAESDALWPGDARYRQIPIVEYVSPFGHFGDPLLGLAMVWIYDCYPFVHTGFVEQFLVRRDISRREFAPRLALRALQTIARELPVQRPSEGGAYWDALHGYVEQGLAWL